MFREEFLSSKLLTEEGVSCLSRIGNKEDADVLRADRLMWLGGKGRHRT